MTSKAALLALLVAVGIGCGGDEPAPAPTIVYAEYPSDSAGFRLARVRADGDGRQVLYDPGGQLGDYEVVRLLPSPDGRTILQVVSGNGPVRFLSTPAAGGPTVPVVLPAGYPGAWSPDGTRVSWHGDDAGVLRLGYARPGSAQFTPLSPPGLNVGRASWSPDGSSLVFEGYDPVTFGRDIFTVSMAADTQRLTDVPGDASTPVWSPDGTRIAYVQVDASGTGVYLVAPDGTGRRQLAPGSFEQELWWSHDGTSLLARRRSVQQVLELVQVDAATGAVQVLGRWVPASSNPLAPDGSRILIVGTNSARNGTLTTVRSDGTEPLQVLPDSLSAFAGEWLPAP